MANWQLLYAQGRCKAIGVSWNEKEAHAAMVLHVPAEYVRRGCLTQEDYKRMVEKDEVSIEKTHKIPILQLKRSQLIALCAIRKLQTSDEATRPVLIEMLLDSGCPKSISVDDVPKALDNEL